MSIQFRQYRNSIAPAEFDPLPQKELNQLVIDYHIDNCPKKLTLIVKSNARLNYKAVDKIIQSRDFDKFREGISVANEALLDAVRRYKEVKIDFAYFAYVHMCNALKTHNKRANSLIKSRVIKGVRHFPQSDWIEDMKNFNPPAPTPDATEEINPDDIIKLFVELEWLKERDRNIVIDYFGLIDGKKKYFTIMSKKYNLTPSRCSQIVEVTINRIKKSPKLMNAFKEIMF